MTEADFTRNPARDVEQYALKVVRRWVGDAGQVEDRSSTAEPDFWISYRDGRSAVGETTWHADPVLQEMWSNVFKQDEHQLVRLPPGQGQWTLRLSRTATISALTAGLRRVITLLNEQAITQVAIEYLMPGLDDELRTLMHEVGVDYIARVDDGGDAGASQSYAIFFPPSGEGGLVPQVDAVVDWINELVAHPAYLDLTSKLESVPGVSERHIFVMSGSATAYGIDHRLQRLAFDLPTRAPLVPPHVTHVWVCSRWRGPHASGCGLWSADAGWTFVPDGT